MFDVIRTICHYSVYLQANSTMKMQMNNRHNICFSIRRKKRRRRKKSRIRKWRASSGNWELSLSTVRLVQCFNQNQRRKNLYSYQISQKQMCACYVLQASSSIHRSYHFVSIFSKRFYFISRSSLIELLKRYLCEVFN
jgi:hypothetical protein